MDGLVSIITATSGREELRRCLDSVQSQTYKPIQHIVVVDGRDKWLAAERILHEYPGVDVITLPYPTRQWGGRIYAAIPVLTMGEYIQNLDDDNFIEPDHIQSLVDTILHENVKWAHSFRKLTVEGRFIANDTCESLGMAHVVWDRPDEYLIDTNCFLLTRKVALELAPFWAPIDFESQNYFNDRIFLKELMSRYPHHSSSYRYTLNYEVPLEKVGYFLAGNKWMQEQYGSRLPWER